MDTNQLILIAQRRSEATASLAYLVARAGYNVSTASDTRDVLRLLRAKPHDLLVLDPTLPDQSGYAVLEELRREEHTCDIGVILLGASEAELDGVRGLALGADDCLTAPISPEEFLLRVAAILRRRRTPGWTPARRLTSGPIVVDRAAFQVTVEGSDIAVTVTEFKLLTALIESDGRVCSREELLETVWDTKGTVQTRTVDMHLQRLRRKLGLAGERIETVRGAGYRLQSEAQSNVR